MAVNKGSFSVYDLYNITYEMNTRTGRVVATFSVDAFAQRRDLLRFNSIQPFTLTFENVRTVDVLQFLATAKFTPGEMHSKAQVEFFFAMQERLRKHVGGPRRSVAGKALAAPEADEDTRCLKLPEMEFHKIASEPPPEGTPLVFLAASDDRDDPITIHNGYFSTKDGTAREASGEDIEACFGTCVFAWAVAPWKEEAMRKRMLGFSRAGAAASSQDDRDHVLLRGVDSLVESSSEEFCAATLDVVTAMIANVPPDFTPTVSEISEKIASWKANPSRAKAREAMDGIKAILRDHPFRKLASGGARSMA